AANGRDCLCAEADRGWFQGRADWRPCFSVRGRGAEATLCQWEKTGIVLKQRNANSQGCSSVRGAQMNSALPAARDTIFALATAPGRAGIAVVRVSGPAASVALQHVTRAPLPVQRLASLRSLHGHDGLRIDQALVLRFPAPHSYTGEDLVEFQT